jgi:indole-3-glycerol phosphate synthase
MGASVVTGTILDRILARTASDLAARKRTTPPAGLERMAAEQAEPLGLRRAIDGHGVAVIAEIKRASPSRGLFPVAVDPPAVARAYLEGGAVALSVLTDAPFFRGSLVDLAAVAAVAHDAGRPAPVLRKDFVLDPYQVVEARAHGADAILLIVAALDDATLADLLATARGHGLDALVEVHDEAEMARAAAAGAGLIGINNRDLRSFSVDLGVTERLAPLAPPGAVLVAESGVFTTADVTRLGRAGIQAVLVGEGLILAPDRTAAVRALLGDRP